MYRIVSAIAAIVMTAGTVAFASPAQAAPPSVACAAGKAAAAAH